MRTTWKKTTHTEDVNIINTVTIIRKHERDEKDTYYKLLTGVYLNGEFITLSTAYCDIPKLEILEYLGYLIQPSTEDTND